MRRRNEHTAHGGAIASVRVGIEHEIGYARRTARVQSLFDALGIEGIADGRRADDGDGFAFITRRGDEARGFARGLDDRFRCFFVHNQIKSL